MRPIVTDDKINPPEPGSLEDKFLALLSDAINGYGYVHRKKLKRKKGHWYQMKVTFQWPANGIINIDRVELRDVRKP